MKDYRPIEYRQVCAIARVVLLANPSMSDSEWKAATRELAAKQGWDEPPADMLARAMSAVERSIAQTIGLRPLVDAPVREPAPQKPDMTAQDWKACAETLKHVLERSARAMPANVVKIAKETWTITEHAALDQFYAEAHEGDRLAALKRFAEIAIARDSDWDQAAVRAAASKGSLFASQCFVCRRDGRSFHWHHVIQIQHGGSNLARNLVPLCEDCHAAIHPWLPRGTGRTTAGGWTSIGGLTPSAHALLERQKGQKAG